MDSVYFIRGQIDSRYHVLLSDVATRIIPDLRSFSDLSCDNQSEAFVSMLERFIRDDSFAEL